MPIHSSKLSFVGNLLSGVLIAWGLCIASVRADEAPKTAVAAHYPAGSIQSTESADRALEEVAAERSVVEARFAEDERACYTKFFANDCREKAQERRRAALAQIRQVEVEANAFKRHAKVAERDAALEEKRAKAEADRREREQNPPQERKPNPPKTISPADEERNRKESDDRRARHEEKLRHLRAEEAANAQKRAENIEAYERKVKEAQAHQREVEERKKEKESERAAKAAPSPAQ